MHPSKYSIVLHRTEPLNKHLVCCRLHLMISYPVNHVIGKADTPDFWRRLFWMYVDSMLLEKFIKSSYLPIWLRWYTGCGCCYKLICVFFCSTSWVVMHSSKHSIILHRTEPLNKYLVWCLLLLMSSYPANFVIGKVDTPDFWRLFRTICLKSCNQS